MPFYSQAWLDEHPELRRAHISLGVHPETGDELLIPNEDRYAGMYILGVPGMGKSGLQETLIAQDASAGEAMVIVDPHGDLIEHVLAAIPQKRIAQTYVLDLEDTEFPFGVNPFEAFKTGTTVERSHAAAKIEHLFEVLWEGALDQQFLPRFVRAVTFTLLDNPGSTLVDVLTLLKQDAFRARVVAHVKATDIREFWRDEFDNRSESERYRRVAPLIGRLEKLFLGKPLVRNVVGQRKSSINFQRVIREKQIILVRLPLKKLGDEARLVGLWLIALVHAAIFSQADLPEGQRGSLSLYLDEFQHFTTGDIEELVTEGRKYNIRLIAAHQVRSKLKDFLREPTMAMRTKIIFQTTLDDARELAPLFSVGGDQITEFEPHATKHLLDYGVHDHLARMFVDFYLRPLQMQKHGGKVEAMGAREVSAWDILPGALDKDGKKREVYLPDPTPYLDNLLYQVMRDQDWLLPIPIDAIDGFANCGGGFYHALSSWNRSASDLSVDVTFPEHLVNETAHGYVWLRTPESDREWFLHCVFHMRMLMKYLAEHPLGKVEKATANDAIQLLTHLPPRAALVKYNGGEGLIYTHPLPRQLTGDALAARHHVVREQTRQTYAHRRAEIENRVTSDATTDPLSFTRWEEAPNGEIPTIPGGPGLRLAPTGEPTDPSGADPAPPVDGAPTDPAAL